VIPNQLIVIFTLVVPLPVIDGALTTLVSVVLNAESDVAVALTPAMERCRKLRLSRTEAFHCAAVNRTVATAVRGVVQAMWNTP
jgi:hypothetical protein